MGEIWAVLIHSLKDMKSNLALADSNGKVLNSSAERKPGPQRCNFFVQKITVTGVELKVPVTNVTIAIQWYHGLLHMDGKKNLPPPYHRKHISPWNQTSTAHMCHLKRAEVLLRTWMGHLHGAGLEILTFFSSMEKLRYGNQTCSFCSLLL